MKCQSTSESPFIKSLFSPEQLASIRSVCEMVSENFAINHIPMGVVGMFKVDVSSEYGHIVITMSSSSSIMIEGKNVMLDNVVFSGERVDDFLAIDLKTEYGVDDGLDELRQAQDELNLVFRDLLGDEDFYIDITPVFASWLKDD